MSIHPLSVPDVLALALPARVRRAHQYFGSFIKLSCTAATGSELVLRVYLADWTFRDPQGSLIDSDGAAASNNERLAILEGSELCEIVAEAATGLRLSFTNGASLVLVANLAEYEPEDELLFGYLEQAMVVFIPHQGFITKPPVDYVSEAPKPAL